MNLFVVLLVAHICGDVLSYSSLLSRAKRSDDIFKRNRAVIIHCLLHAIFVLLLGWLFRVEGSMIAAGYIFIVHFFIDFSRVQIEPIFFNTKKIVIINKNELVKCLLGKTEDIEGLKVFMSKYFLKWLVVNVVDQSLHLASIVVFVLFKGVNI